MKFPFRILSRGRYEKMKCADEALVLRNKLSQLQKNEEANDKILTAAVLNKLKSEKAFGVIDVGANRGDWAQTFSKFFPGAIIYAIEADTRTFQTLCQNLAVAKPPNIRPFNLAVSNKTGPVTFYSDENPLLSSILKLPDLQPRMRTMEIQAQTLDDFFVGNPLDDLRLIKIDTEGHDLDVLRGARRVLSLPALEFIILEFGIDPADQRHVHINELIAYLSPLGFQVYALGGFGLGGGYVYGNVLFVK
jgi:FkbM family methyltransferase